MRLSIVNYGTHINPSVPKYAKMEDNALIKLASEIIEDKNMPKGAVIISEVMHTDLVNFNNRAYVQKGLPDAVKSFYFPHYTPFLMHHEMGGGLLGGDPNLISVGVNLMAQMYKRKVETPTGIASGYVKVATFIPEVSVVGGQSAIDALQSRQLMTLSIGSRVSDEDYRCSICGHSLYSEECEHVTGKEYDGSKCYAKVYNPLFREYSAVYNPSDINAVVRRMDVMEGESYIDGEEHHVDQNYGGYVAIYDTMSGVYPSVDMGALTGKDTDVPPQETPAKEVKDMASVTKDNDSSIPKEVARLIQVCKTAEKELAAKDARIEELEQLVNILAATLREKMDMGAETVPEAEGEEGESTPQVPDSEIEQESGSNDDPTVAEDDTSGDEDLSDQEEAASEDIEEEIPGDEIVEDVPDGDNNESQEESTDEGAQGNETPEDSDVQSEDESESGSREITEDGPDSPEEEGSGRQESALSYKEILVKRRSLNSIKIGSKYGRGEEGKRPLPRRFKI